MALGLLDGWTKEVGSSAVLYYVLVEEYPDLDPALLQKTAVDSANIYGAILRYDPEAGLFQALYDMGYDEMMIVIKPVVDLLGIDGALIWTTLGDGGIGTGLHGCLCIKPSQVYSSSSSYSS